MKRNIDDLLMKKLKTFEEIDNKAKQNCIIKNNINYINNGNKAQIDKNKLFDNKAIFDKLYDFKENNLITENKYNDSQCYSNQFTRRSSKNKLMSHDENKNLMINPTINNRFTPISRTPDSITPKYNISKGNKIDSKYIIPNCITQEKNFDIKLDSKDLLRSRSRTPHLTDTTKEITSATIRRTDNYFKKETIKINKKEKKIQINNYAFKPNLNKNSLKMAERLDPSSSRLMKPKGRNRSSTPEYIENNKLLLRSNTTRCLSQTNLLGHNLYNKAKIYQSKLEEKQKLKKFAEEKEFLALSFKPQLSKKTVNFNNKEDIQGRSFEKYNIIRENRKKLSEMKKEKMKEILDNYIMEDCTFKPQINQEELEDDEEFIHQNLNQIIEYVFRRKRSLYNSKMKKTIEDKVFKTGKNYIPKRTIPREFKLSTNKSPLTDRQITNHDHLKMRELVNQDDFFKKSTILDENYFSNEAFYTKRIASGKYNKKI